MCQHFFQTFSSRSVRPPAHQSSGSWGHIVRSCYSCVVFDVFTFSLRPKKFEAQRSFPTEEVLIPSGLFPTEEVDFVIFPTEEV